MEESNEIIRNMKPRYTDRWLYLDDMRTPTYERFDVVRNYYEFQAYITGNGIPDYISFDHDLSEEHLIDYADQVSKFGFQTPIYDLYTEKTGLDCAKWLCEEYLRENPKTVLKKIGVHSHNPIGSLNIQSYINSFMNHMGWEPTCFLGKPAFKIEENDG